MISAQCDELRKAAQTYRTLGGYEMEQMLLDAADTITELRGALQVASVDYRHLSEENAKLRELCEEQLDNLMPEICAKAWWCDGKDWHTCNDDACGNYTFVILARELGVEVDG